MFPAKVPGREQDCVMEKRAEKGQESKWQTGKCQEEPAVLQDLEEDESEDKWQMPSSSFLIAQSDCARQRQMEFLYRELGPVFFGERRAATQQELEQLFWRCYSIDVKNDFYEGDEHYEEYLEAQQAIAEGMSIYGGSIAFADSALAQLAERLWRDWEKQDRRGFRRINTALEE